ncbi:glycoside hydrolase family 127 protein [Catenovulum sp. 2E275]|uniref:glycoside hydrolase family 127 protein n=1 Tax=Catenovulum sp. 2E275 TaxID=2980497 RepID=UPI0021CF9FA7|nr:glycoside hydrolase family 127 protein [Catenovulum sp. 2E275]MCU4676459.1 glycoside hydrolase family 127 protein [Catenovulum sp. 2E275]
MFKKSKKLLLVGATLLASQISSAFAEPLSTYPLADVKLLDGPFLHAQQTNVEYLLRLSPDKLLAPYLREAGIATLDSYGNWENTGLDGHIGGHYLSALSLSYAASGDVRLKQRLDYMIEQLRHAQVKNGDGYLGGIPGAKPVWRDVAAGKIDADLFSMNKLWVPWYNLHKVYTGLRDAYVIGKNEQAKTMLIDMGRWAQRLAANLSDEQIQTMLITEHGGLNSVFIDIANITGDQSFVTLAERFSQKIILDPLVKSQDKLNGLHANTQIPKVIGFKKVADATGNPQWEKAAEYFWNNIVSERSVVIGGNSVREHFHPSDDFTSMVEDVEGPETCNTYNMLKLSRLLFLTSSNNKYMDYYERALYNHILSSQHPEHGGLVYFTPMVPGHYRIYSQHDKGMWCCVGSGIENHGKYGEMIYAKDDSSIYVNLFIASTLTDTDKGIVLTQNTAFPDVNSTEFTISKGQANFELKIRRPNWIQGGEVEAKLNGETIKVKLDEHGFISLKRDWKTGDKLSLTLPIGNRLEQLPDGQQYFAVMHGPIAMAAKVNPFKDEKLNFVGDDSRMGHIASGPVCPPEATPFIVGEPAQFLAGLTPVAGKPLTYQVNSSVYNPGEEKLELIPFFRLHDSRYEIYWPQTSKAEMDDFLTRAEKAAEQRAALDAITIDKVAPGEQQPESDHFFKGEATEAGVHMGKHWRHTQKWFSYELNDPQQEAKTLRITYFGLDNGRSFEIQINGQTIATETLNGDKGNDFFTKDYVVPADLVANSKGKLTLKFVANPNSIAGGFYGVRLLRQ